MTTTTTTTTTNTITTTTTTTTTITTTMTTITTTTTTTLFLLCFECKTLMNTFVLFTVAFPTGKIDSTLGFKNHEKSATYKEAVEVVLTTPSCHSDIGEQLSNVHAEQKIKHRQALFQNLSCLWFLCQQGLALRGDETECDSNF